MKKKYLAVALAAVCMLLVVTAILLYNGILVLNNPSKSRYPVRGVDVSAYQGLIDWEVLASQNISFAFIKATEGSSFTDKYFEKNYEQAQKTDLRIGAYHFFSYDSPGATQAEHFINTVEKCESMLPPVIDLEFYGDYGNNPPDQAVVRKELDNMISILKEHYHTDPIIYATQKSYSLYLEGAYDNCDIWIRNVFTTPLLSGREWTFWQYTDKARLDGYSGEEKYIDMNVFNGTKEEFAAYAKE